MAENTVPVFDTLAVIGPGLIGSSVLRRAQAEGNLARKLIAVDQSPDVCARVAELGIADEVTTDAAAAAAQADCVMLCVPVGAMGPVAAQVVPAMKPGAILTDVGSTKVSVIEAISLHFGRMCLTCLRTPWQAQNFLARCRAGRFV